jgi:hypothetical protein
VTTEPCHHEVWKLEHWTRKIDRAVLVCVRCDRNAPVDLPELSEEEAKAEDCRHELFKWHTWTRVPGRAVVTCARCDREGRLDLSEAREA